MQESITRDRHRMSVARRRRLAPAFDSLEDRQLLTVSIQFDYSLDKSGIFANPKYAYLKQALEQAGADIASRLNDQLSAIIPSGSNHWTAIFTDPGTGERKRIDDLVVPKNTLKIYVGFGTVTDKSELGHGGPGGYESSGTTTWNDTVAARGQSGAVGDKSSRTDFGPWGGAITFAIGKVFPLRPVALHELGHVLGFGTADSFRRLSVDGTFRGAASMARFGKPVPLDPNGGHWAEGTADPVTGPNASLGNETEMDPSLTGDAEKEFTGLDFAGLADIGWQVSGLQTGAGHLNGRVVDASGNGIPGVRIAANAFAGEGTELGIPIVPFYHTVTSSDGYYYGSLPAGGIWEVSAFGRGINQSQKVDTGSKTVVLNFTANVNGNTGLSLTGAPVAADYDGTLYVQGEDETHDNLIVIERSGTNIVVTVDGNSTTRAIDSTDKIKIGTGTGVDTIIIDMSGGNPIPTGGLSYSNDGGGTARALLKVQGSSVLSARVQAGTPGSGSIDFDGSTITFSGVGAVQVDTSVISSALNLGDDGVHQITLSQTGGQVEFGLNGGFGSFRFLNPVSLSLQGGSGPDLLIEPTTATIAASLATSGVEVIRHVGLISPTPSVLSNPIALTSTVASDSGSVLSRFSSSRPGATASNFAASIDWGDGSSSVLQVFAEAGVPGRFVIAGGHAYARPGRYNLNITLFDRGGESSSTAADGSTILDDYNASSFVYTSATATVAIGQVTLQPVTFSAVERSASFGATASFDAPQTLVPSDFTATIDWGDGSSAVAATILRALPGSFQVVGSHTYAGSGSYPILVTVVPSGVIASRVQAVGAVDDVPIVSTLTAGLDPSSDSGVSSNDGITSVMTPVFRGLVQPGAAVSLVVDSASRASWLVGTTTAGASGSWAITSLPLPDGSYKVTVVAADPADRSTGAATLAPLVIDTAGLRVTGLTIDRARGRFSVSFADASAAINASSLLDPSNFQFRQTQGKSALLAVSRLTIASSGTSVTVSGMLKGGKRLPSGTLNVLLRSAAVGIRDMAVNSLDGEFARSGPSGNGVAGGDYAAQAPARGRLKPMPPAKGKKAIAAAATTWPASSPMSRRQGTRNQATPSRM
jgi:hypothetical protein